MALTDGWAACRAGRDTGPGLSPAVSCRHGAGNCPPGPGITKRARGWRRAAVCVPRCAIRSATLPGNQRYLVKITSGLQQIWGDR